MSLFDKLAIGFGVAFKLQHLLLLAIGCLLGTLIACRPRLGLLAASAMVLPVGDKLGLLPAMFLLTGIYCGAHGGIADAAHVARARLDQTPGDSPPGLAPAAEAAIGNLPFVAQPLLVLIAALLGTVAIAIVAPLLIELAFHFGPAEYFSLMVLGLTASLVLASGSLLKALSMLVLGVLLSQVSIDPQSGLGRFNFDLVELQPGVGFIPMAMGLVTIGHIIGVLGSDGQKQSAALADGQRNPLADLRRHWPKLLRGSAIGALLGALPGGGLRLAAFASRSAERQLESEPAAADSAAGDQVAPGAAFVTAGRSSFIALLGLGFPVNASLALLAGVMLAKDIGAGPQMMTSKPELFWGLIAATALAAVLLYFVGGPMRRLSNHLPSNANLLVHPVVIVFCCVGAFALRNMAFDVFVMALFVVVGYVFVKLGCRLTPMLLGFILGPMMEVNLRHALELSDGSWSVLAVRPISGGLLLAAGLLVAAVMLPTIRKKRSTIFSQAE